MSKSKTTVQGQAWDQLSLNAYGSETHMGKLLPANSEELDTLLFSGDVAVAIPQIEVRAASKSVPPWEKL